MCFSLFIYNEHFSIPIFYILGSVHKTSLMDEPTNDSHASRILNHGA